MNLIEASTKVLAVGLIFGAGLPALFALGLRCHTQGAAITHPNGTHSPGNPMQRALGYAIFALLIAVIAIGLLWITRQTIYYYFDVKLFPFGYK